MLPVSVRFRLRRSFVRLFLAGFCFLAAPEGRLGICAWALRGSKTAPKPDSALKRRL